MAAAGGSLPFEEATGSIEFPNGIDIGHEFGISSDRPGEFDLEMSSGLAYVDAVVLAEAAEPRVWPQIVRMPSALASSNCL